MNLVTNALKYTLLGFIHVSRRQKSRLGPCQRFDAMLNFTDCGTSMLRGFQDKNHLFQEFSQENTQSSGLGIEMHIVARMVRAIGGEIEVTSGQKGIGTLCYCDHVTRRSTGL